MLWRHPVRPFPTGRSSRVGRLTAGPVFRRDRPWACSALWVGGWGFVFFFSGTLKGMHLKFCIINNGHTNLLRDVKQYLEGQMLRRNGLLTVATFTYHLNTVIIPSRAERGRVCICASHNTGITDTSMLFPKPNPNSNPYPYPNPTNPYRNPYPYPNLYARKRHISPTRQLMD